jgi:NADH:ubiquinone oxidoreductase subunit 2 (subunit N)
MSFNSFNLLVFTILLFSMAGVPPFIGFFSKLFILSLLTNNSFFILYFLFFVILFFGLYFYVQNIKFLYSTKLGELNYSYLKNEIVVLNYYYFVICILTVTCFGLFFIDDFILLFS